jgi:hypothetical protein
MIRWNGTGIKIRNNGLVNVKLKKKYGHAGLNTNAYLVPIAKAFRSVLSILCNTEKIDVLLTCIF